jgi:TetR/AcrR family tetracycline transcriptional repressor
MAIDRDLAAHTALRLLDEEGLDRLSLRRIAKELNVQAPALYWHFTNKRALMDHMTDLMLAPVLSELDAPVGPGEWPQWLIRIADALHRALLAHTDGARVALGADLRRAVALGAFFERTVVVLHEAGFGLVDASRAAGGFIAFVLGRTAEEQAQPDLGGEPEGGGGASSLALYPTFSRAMAERRAAQEGPDEAFRYCVMIMVEGLRAVSTQSVPS